MTDHYTHRIDVESNDMWFPVARCATPVIAEILAPAYTEAVEAPTRVVDCKLGTVVASYHADGSEEVVT